MKPLNKEERWYAFLEIVYEGHEADKLPFAHIDFGFLSMTHVPIERQDELDDYIQGLWSNPPRVKL